MIDYTDKKERKKFYNSAAWRKVRTMVLERDGYECVWCKEEGKLTIDQYRGEGQTLLEVDHIKPLEQYPTMKLEPDNLRTLCKKHHNIRHNRFYKRKEKWNDEKW